MLTGSACQLLRAHVLSPHQLPCFLTTRPRQLKYKPTPHRINSSQGGQSGPRTLARKCRILWENLLKVRQSLGLAGSVPVTAREDESEEAALQRRLRESARVEERVIQIYNEKEFQQQLEEVSFMHLHLIVGTSSRTH